MAKSDPRDYYKSKYKELEDLPELGEATAKKLRSANFSSVEMIAQATPEELIQVGLGEETAKKLISAARKGFAMEFITGEDLLNIRANQKFLTTGCPSLDEILIRRDTIGQPRGLPTESITEFIGENGSGKSQICHQLCATVQLPESEGGFDGSALYIDTENVFTGDRIVRIARRFPALKDKPVREILNKVIFAEAYTSDHQMTLLDSAEDVIKDNNVKLLIVDSITGNFRAEYLGRETLATRQQHISEHMHKLMRYARIFNLVAVVTNQVQADPSGYASFEPKAIGGHIVGHVSHDRIFLKKGRDLTRIAKIIKSPYLPEASAAMKLTDDGIVSDVEAPK